MILIEKITIENSKQKRTFDKLLHCIQESTLYGFQINIAFRKLPDSERTFENLQKLKLDNSNFSTLITVFASLPKSEQEKEMHTLSHIINGLINGSIQFFYDKIDFGKKLKSAITKSESQNQSKSNHTKDEINR